MKKEYILIISILGLSLFFLFYISIINKKINDISLKNELLISEKNYTIKYLFDRDSLMNNSIGTFLPIVLTDAKKIKNDLIIYLRLHENICFSCYAESLLELKSIFQNNSYNFYLHILGTYNYNATFISILKEYDLFEFPYINYKVLDTIDADNLNTPYLFSLNKNSKIDHILFLNKNSDNSSRIQYFMNMLIELNDL